MYLHHPFWSACVSSSCPLRSLRSLDRSSHLIQNAERGRYLIPGASLPPGSRLSMHVILALYPLPLPRWKLPGPAPPTIPARPFTKRTGRLMEGTGRLHQRLGSQGLQNFILLVRSYRPSRRHRQLVKGTKATTFSVTPSRRLAFSSTQDTHAHTSHHITSKPPSSSFTPSPVPIPAPAM